MNLNRLYLIVVPPVLVLALTSCGAKKKEAADSDAAQTVQVAAAARGPIEHIVHADAILYPVNQSAVTPKVSAPIKKFYVNRGDRVKAGQLLVSFENTDLEAAASESKALLSQAEAQAATTVRGTVPEDTTKAQSDVASARQALDAAQKLYDNRVKLVQEGALAQKLADDAKVALVQAQSAFDNAQRHLESLNSVSRAEQIKGAQSQVDAAKARYASAQAQVSYTAIRSPISGIVSDRPSNEGEIASAGNAVLTVVDISEIVARANVPSSEIQHLKVGQTATITAPSGELTGKVTVVSPAVDPSSTTVEVWIRAKNQDQALKPGVTAKVAIHAETVDDAVVIPASALVTSDEGETEVMVVDSQSVVHERKVETGISQDDKIQITSGLKPGENVVISGGVGLADKAKVEIAKPDAEKPDAEKPAADDKKGAEKE